MTRTITLVVAALVALGACAAPQAVTGRADNDMLRFSAMDYVVTAEAPRWDATR